jgi:hypothetical protein
LNVGMGTGFLKRMLTRNLQEVALGLEVFEEGLLNVGLFAYVLMLDVARIRWIAVVFEISAMCDDELEVFNQTTLVSELALRTNEWKIGSVVGSYQQVSRDINQPYCDL